MRRLDVVSTNGGKASLEVITHDGLALPIPKELRYYDRLIRELEDALIHMWEFMPSESGCGECQRIKEMVHRFMVERSKELGKAKKSVPLVGPV